jgi:hypothetical protein
MTSWVIHRWKLLLVIALLTVPCTWAGRHVLRPAQASPSRLEAEAEYATWLGLFQNALNGTVAWNPDKAVEAADKVADEAMARMQTKRAETLRRHGVEEP